MVYGYQPKAENQEVRSLSINPEIDKFAKEMGIGKIVGTLQSATGRTARVEESVSKHPGVQPWQQGHTESKKSYTIPLKETEGKLVESEYGEVHVTGTDHVDYYTQGIVGEKKSKTKRLEDNVQISIIQRDDDPGNAVVAVSTTKYMPTGDKRGVFAPTVKHDRMNITLNSGNRQDELLGKITNLLENINKK